MHLRFLVFGASLALIACASDPADPSDTASGETGMSTQSEAGSAEGGETSAEESESADGEESAGEETGGGECAARYESTTSFSVDLSAWPVEVPEWQVVNLTCTTIQAELQGLGMVFGFDCMDGMGGTGAIQVTFAPTSGVEPDLQVGGEVTVSLEGGNFGGLHSDGPTPIDFNYPAQAIAIRDQQGVIAGGVSGISVPDAPFFGQFGFEFTSPCGEPNMNADFDGELVVSEPDITGGTTETLMVGESVNFASALGGSYHVELGRLIRYGCCETPWAVDFVIARL